jgi:hypothetical protein
MKFLQLTRTLGEPLYLLMSPGVPFSILPQGSYTYITYGTDREPRGVQEAPEEIIQKLKELECKN